MTNAIGMVGSPSTTGKATVDVLEEATNAGLHGQLVYLAHQLGDKFLIALGTVMEIRTSNRWHEDPNMRGVLKIHGSLPHLSAVGDVRTAEVGIQAAYLAESLDVSDGEAPLESGGALSMSPTTGAPISLVTDDFLTQLLRRHVDEITYLGSIYKTDVRLPLTIRDFRSAKEGGAGEPYHTGIFGMTGSGKSALATYLMAAQLRHPALGVIVMDPQGQFSGGEASGLPFSLEDWAKSQGRPVWKLSLSNDLRLPKDAYLLGDLLGLTRFFRDLLSIKHSDSRDSAVAEFTRMLQNTAGWESQPAEDVLRDILTSLSNDQAALTRIYATKTSRDKLVSMIQNILNDPTLALEEFAPLHNLFTSKNISGGNRRAMYPLLQAAIDPTKTPRPLVLIDYSASGNQRELLESSQVKARIIRLVCSRLNHVAEEAYREGGSLNVLVVFDEAQRFAPQDAEGDEQVGILADRLVDYVRTTRKYGLGWMFITQETASLRQGIYRQLRVRAFGYGLTSGSELSRLRDSVGDDSAIDLYRTFVDPGAISASQYPFMLQGPISPLSFTGAPLFLSVFTDFEKFKAANNIA